MIDRISNIFVEKYRPRQLSEFKCNYRVIEIVNRMLESNFTMNFLFYGPPGTGKTTLAWIIAKSLVSNSYNKNIIELNASDDRGIDIIRNKIKQFAELKLSISEIKIVILDEADNMTKFAQFCLRKIIEDFSFNLRFIIIANYDYKIIEAIQSRCCKIRFPKLEFDYINQYISFINIEEHFNLDNSDIIDIVEVSDGDMRKAINILQSYNLSLDKSPNLIYELGNKCKYDICKQIIEILINSNFDRFDEGYFDYYMNKLSSFPEINNIPFGAIINEIANQCICYDIEFHFLDDFFSELSFIDLEYQVNNDRNLGFTSLISLFSILSHNIK